MNRFPAVNDLSRNGALRVIASRAFVAVWEAKRAALADWPTFEYYVSGGW